MDHLTDHEICGRLDTIYHEMDNPSISSGEHSRLQSEAEELESILDGRNFHDEPDNWSDADTFISIGWGSDEDYGYFGGDEW